MTLTLEIVGSHGAQVRSATNASKVFAGAGGSIGRAADNDWVIPDPYISGKHARVHFRDGQYLLEDTSSNGVFVNSPANRLPRGELYQLRSGDRIFIDTYEIKVTLIGEAQTGASTAVGKSPLADLFGSPQRTASPPPAPSNRAPIPDDPFAADDPFGSPNASRPVSPPPARNTSPLPPSGSYIPDDFGISDGLQPHDAGPTDPLALLGLDSKKATTGALTSQDLHRQSPLNDHFVPPAAQHPVPPPTPSISSSGGGGMIPEGYDPLLDDLAPPPPAPSPPVAPVRPQPGLRQTPAPPLHQTAGNKLESTSDRLQPPPAVTNTSPAKMSGGGMDFTAMLEAAGLRGVEVTPELAQNFGRILQTVVAGLMDVLRAREQIKNEFRMRMTTFKVADNNPLKFSANVEDALFNLLVKRNSAYLGPAEAFEDAFQDVRNHQVAMLAGVRVAFDTMLNEFDPEHLQQIFDRQSKKASFISAPAKLRYWEQYRDKYEEMTKDPENNFRELFGDEFARAYEEQLEKLKAAARLNRPTQS